MKKRKPAGSPAGAPSKKPTLRRQKMTSLDAHGAQPSSHKFLFATTALPPPPSSPPSMPAGDMRRVEEPEHTVHVQNVTETAPSHDLEVPVTKPVGLTMVHDDIKDAFNNVIDPIINRG
ncbi:hypothetical protein Hanom_Chr16g01468821 [Helianthus anomalus]